MEIFSISGQPSPPFQFQDIGNQYQKQNSSFHEVINALGHFVEILAAIFSQIIAFLYLGPATGISQMVGSWSRPALGRYCFFRKIIRKLFFVTLFCVRQETPFFSFQQS